MNEQIFLQKKLNEKFAEAKARNPLFTLRGFSKKLAMNSGVVSSIMNGKRKVSLKVATHLVDRLMLDPQERSEVLSLFPERSRHIQDQTQKGSLLRYMQLSADHFHVISDWYHFAILSLMKTLNFESNPRWMSERLGISQSKVEGALDKLKRLGMISQNSEGVLERSAPHYRTTDDVSSVALRKAHLENLHLAQISLERDPVQSRDFTAMTMAVDPSKLPLAKELIRKFQDDLSAIMETDKQTEVYKICVQLFPLTQIENSEK